MIASPNATFFNQFNKTIEMIKKKKIRGCQRGEEK